MNTIIGYIHSKLLQNHGASLHGLLVTEGGAGVEVVPAGGHLHANCVLTELPAPGGGGGGHGGTRAQSSLDIQLQATIQTSRYKILYLKILPEVDSS